MKTLVVILLAFAVASIECQREKEPRNYDDAKRSDARDVIHEAAKFINEQTHLDQGARLDLLKKLLKHEISFDDAVKVIEQTPGKKAIEHDTKFQMRVKEIAEKLKNMDKTVPDYIKDRMQERYVNREKLNGSL
jgi:hypothetical protein